jgi:glycosyltransferase involved in cell wall biosynthesis
MPRPAAPPPARRPRVLWIWHAAVVAEYQKPIAALAATGRWDMRLLAPTAWPERGDTMLALERTRAPNYTIEAGRVLFARHYYLYLFPDLLGRLLRARPDIIYLYEEAHTLIAFLTLLLRPALERRWGRRVPVLLYAAQNIVKRYPPPFRFFEAYCFRRADAIIACGDLVAATLRKKGYRGRLAVIPLPTDPAVFARDARAGAALRAELGIPPEAIVVGYAGKLAEEKGVRTLLRAFLAAPGAARLLLAGAGPLRATLEADARAAGASDRVRFLGALPHARLVAALSAGDIWVVPSETRPHWREQFGRAAVEAMACGAAVIVSDSGELPRVVDGAARVVPEGDVVALQAALSGLIADPAARAALACAGRARALACYTPERVAAMLGAVFDEVRAGG